MLGSTGVPVVSPGGGGVEETSWHCHISKPHACISGLRVQQDVPRYGVLARPLGRRRFHSKDVLLGLRYLIALWPVGPQKCGESGPGAVESVSFQTLFLFSGAAVITLHSSGTPWPGGVWISVLSTAILTMPSAASRVETHQATRRCRVRQVPRECQNETQAEKLAREVCRLLHGGDDSLLMTPQHRVVVVQSFPIGLSTDDLKHPKGSLICTCPWSLSALGKCFVLQLCVLPLAQT